jgi:predicted CoA-binding protein
MSIDLALDLLKTPGSRFAVVGASADSTKYGNVIFRWFQRRNLTVFPVNPRGGQVEGVDVRATLVTCPECIDMAVFVTPPEASLKVLAGVPKGAVRCLWFQEGSYNQAVLEAARAVCDHVVHGNCIMVVGNRVV